MGQGIQIKKPERSDAQMPVAFSGSASSEPLVSPAFMLMLILSFPASLVALFFFLQTRSL